MHHVEPRGALRPLSLASLALLATLGACTHDRQDLTPASSTGEGGQTSTFASASSSGSASQASHSSSTSSTSSAPAIRGPLPATATANFPFPQNRQATRCTYPTNYLNSDVQAAYAKFKADLVTSNNAGGNLKIQRTATDGQSACLPLNASVSEGIGYGMLIAVYMNDQTLFDNLWLYEQQHLDQNGLMNWAPDGSGMGCGGGAFDADEDMAFALVMASKQWPNQGTLSKSYLDSAIGLIQSIWRWEIDNYRWPMPGDMWGQTNKFENISYFAPAYYRVFQAVDPLACAQGVDPAKAGNCDGWLAVIDQSYSTLSDSLTNGNGSNGLVPAWCDNSNAGSCGASAGQPFNYQYDSCRTPFRIGLDWCLNGEARAQAYVSKTSSFFAPIGASAIVDGYNLDGTPSSGAKTGAAPFIGPAAVGAMSAASNQSFVDGAYTLLAQDNSFQGGEYYASSWTVMSLLMMTGNFLDYTNQSPTH
jgi:endo-1,4-beta-D-glucanase Y